MSLRRKSHTTKGKIGRLNSGEDLTAAADGVARDARGGMQPNPSVRSMDSADDRSLGTAGPSSPYRVGRRPSYAGMGGVTSVRSTGSHDSHRSIGTSALAAVQRAASGKKRPSLVFSMMAGVASLRGSSQEPEKMEEQRSVVAQPSMGMGRRPSVIGQKLHDMNLTLRGLITHSMPTPKQYRSSQDLHLVRAERAMLRGIANAERQAQDAVQARVMMMVVKESDEKLVRRFYRVWCKAIRIIKEKNFLQVHQSRWQLSCPGDAAHSHEPGFNCMSYKAVYDLSFAMPSAKMAATIERKRRKASKEKRHSGGGAAARKAKGDANNGACIEVSAAAADRGARQAPTGVRSWLHSIPPPPLANSLHNEDLHSSALHASQMSSSLPNLQQHHQHQHHEHSFQASPSKPRVLQPSSSQPGLPQIRPSGVRQHGPSHGPKQAQQQYSGQVSETEEVVHCKTGRRAMLDLDTMSFRPVQADSIWGSVV
mmetsp:Transcript_7870/g.17323  ORF Transcript_7870/g.17323 Transcript_7870/m.17323 type:complete len:481 (-) Transcript_7870:75-1517(-)